MQGRSNTGGGSRPFSTTNPFRTAAADPSLNQYKADQQFQDWAASQLGNSTHSSFSGSYNIDDDFNGIGRGQTSPSRSGHLSPRVLKQPSTNPFLDDLESIPDSPPIGRNTQRQQQAPPPPPPPSQSVSKNNFSTSTEEKERLRQRYLTEERTIPSSNPTIPPPPSYEEAAGRQKAKDNIYPQEKSSSDRSHRSHRSHSHHHRDREHERGTTDRKKSTSQSKKEKRKSKMPKNVDTIDKMDVTALFGGSFHHDGPFDACTPHRNKNNKAAPVMAFPVDGPNSTIGGASSKQSAMDEVFGRDDVDDDNDLYKLKGGNSTKDAIRTNIGDFKQMDAKNKATLVHGPITGALGSTTFLDGAPVDGGYSDNAGLQRNKSISYRMRDSNNNNKTSNGNLRRNMTTNTHSSSRYNSDLNYSNSNNNTSRFNGGGGAATRNMRTTGNVPRITRTQSDNADMGSVIGNQDDNEDVYLGVRFDPSAKKKSTGSKLLSRVKSLKVGRK
ncbi:Pal1p NDAI_0C04600 [Naumovozyma dairenensis CBS 421]|uniref:Pal1 cell morphology protein n=1 Tax=Naumovozyma dairenensis (strain ATCC 10597 / BCRC 20456 / CBS 421 / NBRC 0211 / NRRL Y-12639) TaxID=1071378 RepID=G0W8K9_NAUDC|nr:hypothetical protein NDAI_0C04600 [Naumovozyma dairenensis CBS 421]CCD24120.1 hypothetical protein NDAI_0C04600 [Naumovozyma dairenensis CBS 421]